MMVILFIIFIAVCQGAVLIPGPVLPDLGASNQFRTQDDIGNYAFGYDEEHLSGGSFRKESGDVLGNKVGSYGLRDADGRMRIVNYVADAAGFRADVMTNEPGTIPQNPADATINKATTLITPPVVSELVYTAPQPVVQPPVVSEVVYTAPQPIVPEVVYTAPQPIVSEIVYTAPQPVPKPPVVSEVVYIAPQSIPKPPAVSEVVYTAPQPLPKRPVVPEVVYTAQPQPVPKRPVFSELVYTAQPQPIPKRPVFSEVVYTAPQPVPKRPILSEVVYTAPQPVPKRPVVSEVVYTAPQPVPKRPVVSEVVNTVAGPVVEYATLPVQYPAFPNIRYGLPSVPYQPAQPRPQYPYPGVAGIQTGYLPPTSVVQPAIQYPSPSRGVSLNPEYGASPLKLVNSGLSGYYL